MWLNELEDDKDKGEYSELCENKGSREALECVIAEIESMDCVMLSKGNNK